MKVLVAITEPERESALVETAAALACGGEVVLASVIEVTGEDTLASAQPEARGRRRALDALAADLGPGRHVRSLVTVARVGWDAIREACANEHPDLLLVGWRRPGWDLLGTTIEAILRDPPSDVAVLSKVSLPLTSAAVSAVCCVGDNDPPLHTSVGVPVIEAVRVSPTSRSETGKVPWMAARSCADALVSSSTAAGAVIADSTGASLVPLMVMVMVLLAVPSIDLTV